MVRAYQQLCCVSLPLTLAAVLTVRVGQSLSKQQRAGTLTSHLCRPSFKQVVSALEDLQAAAVSSMVGAPELQAQFSPSLCTLLVVVDIAGQCITASCPVFAVHPLVLPKRRLQGARGTTLWAQTG